jgi:hypothetical protein
MKCTRGFFLLAISILSLDLYAQVNRPIGINIAAVSDYSTELVFTNAFRQARTWISYNADNTGPWDTDIDVALRPDGYPLEIPYDNGVNPPQAVKTVLTWDLFEGTPTGVFRLKSSGIGQIRLSHGHFGTFNSPIDTLITVNNNTVSGGVIFEILSSQASDPIHDVQFILPDYTDTYANQKYTSVFLDFISDFQVIRFMDFTRTNGSSVVSWADRTPANYYTQSKQSGAAWEYVVEIANLTQKDIWINIPHQANDAYIDSLAHFLHNNLNPVSKIYLEYSNEVWNSIFSQNSYSAQMAESLGYTGFPWERAWKYTAKRSADMFVIFNNVFEDDDRLVKIIPVQAANSWLTNQFVTFFNDPLYNPNQVTADAIAIAPYFGHNVANNIVSGNMAESITVEQIIDSLDASLDEAMLWMTNNLAVANTHNLDLICYEGGQHLVATGNNMNIDVLTEKLKATNHHEGMIDLYCAYFDYWFTEAGGLFCHFSSTGRYSKYGSWGVKEFEHDTLNPKYIGLQDCVFSYNTALPCTITGCIDSAACNYIADADCEDGSCTYAGCTDASALNYNPQAGCEDGSCLFVSGCLDPMACNYNSQAVQDDSSCTFPGCTQPDACNYDSTAGCDDGTCLAAGCTDAGACNFDSNAACDDSSCVYLFGDISGPQLVYTQEENVYEFPCDQGCVYQWSVSDIAGTSNSAGILIGADDDCAATIAWGNQSGTATVNVAVTCDNGCSNAYSHDVQLEMDTTNIVHETALNSMLLFPNPTFDHVTLSVSPSLLGSVMRVYGLIGNLIVETTVTHLEVNLNTAAWASGVYRVVLEKDGLRVNEMLMKQ